MKEVLGFLQNHKPKDIKENLLKRIQISCSSGPGYFLYIPKLEEHFHLQF